ncbi:hypothetical protein ABGB18_11045 [Nonomuraea sp. B12E4]|uniref:DUF7736 domain-containing protein n=1 Tax=Nonomuraea sp. B12E4 TaxID=3153564 RepID=UPI00325F0945
MPETRDFHLGDILSITTGMLVSPSHIDGVYRILNWMTGDNLFTHQLPRVGEACKGSLLQQHPDLADVQVPEDLDGKEAVLAWLSEQVARFGETRPVARLDPADHTRIDPFDEIRMIRPDMPIISIELKDDHD